MSTLELILLGGFIVVGVYLVWSKKSKGNSVPAVPPTEYPNPFEPGNKENDETGP